MSKGTKLLGIALLASVALAGMAADTPSQTMGKVRTVEFITAVKVGGVLLPAGEYKVLHTMEGDNHVMVFQQMNVGKKNQATAKIKCTLKTLDKAADQSLIGYKSENNEKVLNFLQFKGDTAVHQF